MRTLILIFALTVSAAEARPATKAERASVLTWARENMVNPYSIRSPGISEITEARGDRGDITVFCVEMNAKNEVGGYTGLERYAFAPMSPVGAVQVNHRYGVMTSTCYDPRVTMKPFPELSKIQ